MNTKTLRHVLAYVLICILGMGAITAIVYFDRDADQRRERIDTLYPGPYLVELLTGDRIVFLGWRVTIRGGIPDYKDLWVDSIADAHRYADEESAIEQAQKFGGVAVRLREVL